MTGPAGRWGYWRERRGRNLIQATMAMAASSQGENREWTVKLRTARATMAMRARAMRARAMRARGDEGGHVTGLRPSQAVCGSGV
jgi:hypothetical protein